MSSCGIFSRSQKGSENKRKIYGYLSSQRELSDQRNVPVLFRECQEHSRCTYGYRRVHIWLERQGIHKNPKTVLRVMQKYNLLSEVRRKKYHNYTNGLYKYPNLLAQDFHAERPNQKWVTDISYIKTGKVYYIFRLFATSMTTVLLPTKPAPNRTLTLFSPRSELPRERKRSPQSYSSTVTKAFNIHRKHILS